MIYNMYAIKDELNGFYFPVHYPNDETAKRAFLMQCNENEIIKTSPTDFSLWRIGEYQSDNGTVIPYTESEHKLIMRGESNASN